MKYCKLLNRGHLKIIAFFAMLIDHIGAVFFPHVMLFQLVGRISFPIYALLLVNGLIYTKNVFKYMFRILLLALVSEIFYDLLFYQSLFYIGDQNVLFELLLGLVLLYIVKFHNPFKNTSLKLIALISLVLLTGFLADLFSLNYGMYGIFFIYFCYIFNSKINILFIFILLLNIIFIGLAKISLLQIFSLLSWPILLCYNEKKGKSNNFLFYILYPLHIIVLLIIKYILINFF